MALIVFDYATMLATLPNPDIQDGTIFCAANALQPPIRCFIHPAAKTQQKQSESPNP